MLEGWQVNTIFMYETGAPLLTYDNFYDFSGTGEGPGNANNDRWNIAGSPNNFKWSPSDPIPFLSNGEDADGNTTFDPICAAVANTAALRRR